MSQILTDHKSNAPAMIPFIPLCFHNSYSGHRQGKCIFRHISLKKDFSGLVFLLSPSLRIKLWDLDWVGKIRVWRTGWGSKPKSHGYSLMKITYL